MEITITIRYGVTANITAFHDDRGSSGFDSPYRNVLLIGSILLNALPPRAAINRLPIVFLR